MIFKSEIEHERRFPKRYVTGYANAVVQRCDRNKVDELTCGRTEASRSNPSGEKIEE
jgi:hypothetical protein